ncbi:MAG: hypothetical protein PSV16_12195 [Flavobacterium sp.]|nr:hypothetical protein [Flavobacterium sp.]
MKKKLEAELISIAHRILQLKNKSDLLQLHKEAQILYEKLSLLKFVEENFADAKPTISYAEIEAQIESAFEKEEEVEVTEVSETKQKTFKKADAVKEEVIEAEALVSEVDIAAANSETVIAETENPTEVSETTEIVEVPEQPESVEEVNDALEYESIAETEQEILSTADAGVSETNESATKEDDFMPSFELAFDKKEDEKEAPKEQKQIAFEDFLGHDYNESFFVKAGEVEAIREEVPAEETHEKIEEAHEAAAAPQHSDELENQIAELEVVEEQKPQEEPESKPVPTSDHFSKSIAIGLNDRIGFEKQLFGGSSEDLNRVLSQLNTFDSFQEAQDFIEDMVKPDYNNWEGKDDYAQRFMDIVEKKFA